MPMSMPDAKVYDPAGEIGKSPGCPGNAKVLSSLPKAGSTKGAGDGDKSTAGYGSK